MVLKFELAGGFLAVASPICGLHQDYGQWQAEKVLKNLFLDTPLLSGPKKTLCHKLNLEEISMSGGKNVFVRKSRGERKIHSATTN